MISRFSRQEHLQNDRNELISLSREESTLNIPQSEVSLVLTILSRNMLNSFVKKQHIPGKFNDSLQTGIPLSPHGDFVQGTFHSC